MGEWKVVGCKVRPEVYELLSSYGSISCVLRDAIDLFLRSRSDAKNTVVNQSDGVVNRVNDNETSLTKGDEP